MVKGCLLHKIAWVLLVVGALNWGLVGVANLNLVNLIFGGAPMLERIVYVFVGLAAVISLLASKCKKCVDASCEECKVEPAGEPKKM